jgi:hypothetical protein
MFNFIFLIKEKKSEERSVQTGYSLCFLLFLLYHKNKAKASQHSYSPDGLKKQQLTRFDIRQSFFILFYS